MAREYLTPPDPKDDENFLVVPPEWVPRRSYAVGDKVSHEGKVYKCIAALPYAWLNEVWNPNDWSFLYTFEDKPDSDKPTGPGTYSTKTCKLVIRYRTNGASGTAPPDQTVTYSGEKKEVTLKRTIVGQGEMVWTNHYFLGWSTDSNATEGDIWPGYIWREDWDAEGSGTTRITLYAVWNSRGRIIYKPGMYANEASNIWHDRYQGLPESGNVTLKGAIFNRKGYTVSGWIHNNEYFGAANEEIPATNFGAETDLYPNWDAKKYKVVFKSNYEGSAEPDIVWDNNTPHGKVSYDSEQIIPDFTAFSREGYHISFWNEKADGTGGVWFPGKTYLYNVDRNVTLYAQWSGNEYRVVYFPDEEAAGQGVLLYIVDCPVIGLNETDEVVSTSEDYSLNLDSEDVLILNPANLTLGADLIDEYSVATYGSPFYTDYRPKSKDNRSFNGWKTLDGEILIKKDVWMDAYSFPQIDTANYPVDDSTWLRTNDVVLYPIWSDAYPFGKLFFGRKESTEYGFIINEPPSYRWPSKPYDHKNLRGKNGDVIVDFGYYTNTIKKYSITGYIKDNPELAAKNISDFLHRYNGYNNYIRIEDSYEPDVYMLGIYEESNSLESIVGQAWKGEIEFSCKPQKYLLSGSRKIDVIQTDTLINNPTNYPAFPIIQIWGIGTIHFYGRPTRIYTSGKKTNEDQTDSPLKKVDVTVYSNSNQIIIDSETFDTTDINGDNKNGNVYFDDRIALYPGENTITYEGDIEKISIIPRWWRL